MVPFSILGIVLGLVILVVLSMKGFSVFISAIAASIAIALCSGISLQQAVLTDFMAGFVGFIQGNFMVFAAGALMGKAYEMTNGAKAVARLFIKLFGQRFAPYAVLAAIWVMTGGGIAGFVLAFSVFPIALEVFREANLPRNIIPGLIIAGCCTASSWGAGVAQPVNSVMANGFGISLMAAAVPSFIMMAAAMATSFIVMAFLFKKAKANGEGFIAGPNDPSDEGVEIPNGWVALIPLIVAVLLINVKINGSPILPTAFGIFVGAVLAVLLMRNNITKGQSIATNMGQGFTNALTSIGNTAAMVAVGSVARATIGFAAVLEGVTGMGGNPLISATITALIISSITGGATGAVGLVAPLLTPIYTSMGANLEMIGRIVSSAGHIGGLLPNGGFVNTTITGIAQDTYKNCWTNVFLLSTFANIVATVVGIIVMTIMGVYL